MTDEQSCHLFPSLRRSTECEQNPTAISNPLRKLRIHCTSMYTSSIRSKRAISFMRHEAMIFDVYYTFLIPKSAFLFTWLVPQLRGRDFMMFYATRVVS